jgi:hypothetical protein
MENKDFVNWAWSTSRIQESIKSSVIFPKKCDRCDNNSIGITIVKKKDVHYCIKHKPANLINFQKLCLRAMQLGSYKRNKNRVRFL